MFFVYLIIGGMPDAIKTYVATKDIREVDKVQRDIGLLTSQYPSEIKIELINNNGEVNNGAHFENIIAQQLTANGFNPYFCKQKK